MLVLPRALFIPMGFSIVLAGATMQTPHRRAIHHRALPTVDSLFPLGTGVSSWTTFPGAPNPLPLDNTTLNPFASLRELGPFFEQGPNDKLAIRIHYQKGSYKLSGVPPGGISFYSTGPEKAKLSGDPDAYLEFAREATFGYAVYFPGDFDFVMGGKLPGFYGGNTDDPSSISCGGGKHDSTCFSTRLMWRTDGAGEVYGYFPPSNRTGFEANAAMCDVPENVCDPTYGISLARGNYTFKRGEWTTVSQRVRLNDPGQANGLVELWADGVKVISTKGIVIRDDTGKGRIQGVMFQSFFGGNTTEWSTPRDQDIWISDLAVAVTEDLRDPIDYATDPGRIETIPDNSTAPPKNDGSATNIGSQLKGVLLASTCLFLLALAL